MNAQECISNGKVEARTRWASDVGDDEIDLVRTTSRDERIERARPDLPVRREVIRRCSDFECQCHQFRILSGCDGEKTGSEVWDTARCVHVLLECICRGDFSMRSAISIHYSPVAMRMRVVPVSTIPAVSDRILL